MIDDNYENDNEIKNNINNYNCFSLDENQKKKEINIEPEFNDNDNDNNNNLDLFAFLGNNVNNSFNSISANITIINYS